MERIFLQPDVELSVDGSNVFLRRKQAPVVHILGVAEAVALSFLAATGNRRAAAAACNGVLPNGEYWLNRVINRFWTYLGDGTPRLLNHAWLAQLAACRPVFPILPMSRVQQEPAPATVTWMVTLGCNRRCPYCFFDVFHHQAERQDSPKDATFPFDDAARMIREMALIGAADLYLTGGEPLLRKDLTDLLLEAKRVRVRTHITTKYPIKRPLARDLSEAGLTSVTVSLDDARPQQAAGLAGARDYLAEATYALRALLETGIELSVNAVATQVNGESLERLADYLVQLGVSKLKISPFIEPYPGRSRAHSFQTPPLLSEKISRIQEKHMGSLAVELDAAQGSKEGFGLSCVDHAVCEIGTRSLHVMPDGSVSRCRYLPGVPEMIVGSLRTSTLLDIWKGAGLRSLTRPGREPFAGTACSECSSHDACNSRGRCYVSALMNAGRLHAPDDYCLRSES